MKATYVIEGIPGETQRVAATDVVQQFVAGITALNGAPAIGAIIFCEDNNVRYTFVSDPTQGANPIGHLLYPGTEITLGGGRLVREFRFINEVLATVGTLQVTPLFEVGRV